MDGDESVVGRVQLSPKSVHRWRTRLTRVKNRIQSVGKLSMRERQSKHTIEQIILLLHQSKLNLLLSFSPHPIQFLNKVFNSGFWASTFCFNQFSFPYFVRQRQTHALKIQQHKAKTPFFISISSCNKKKSRTYSMYPIHALVTCSTI